MSNITQESRFKQMADVFYLGTDKYEKAKAAAILLDNRLSNKYRDSGTSDIHFDQSSYNAYFDYDKLVQLPGYEAKLKIWLN